MGMINLTVQVLDLSPRVTSADLNMFFSYCGTVDTIQLQRNQDRSQLAFVTFKQPYAFQTALLLNGAIIVDHPVRILALQDSEVPPILQNMNNETQNHEKQGLIPATQAKASKGVEMLNQTKDEKKENCEPSEQGRALVNHTRSVICSAERTAGRVRNAIVSNECISNSALWLSGVLHKASKLASGVGTKNRDNRNCWK
ncbi:hypothetical protein L1049_006067 [Liquidambar formosana]|uniref:RRM domain-containing protein n=1 Tax=Liquidambar formosana TaxID=63359 RepID=A0AAP0WT58_LIQFO